MTETKTQAYREWLTSAPTARGVLETIEIHHDAWGSIYFANWDTPVDCNVSDKDPVQMITFRASRFVMEPPELSDGTEQGSTISVSSLDGMLYGEMKSLTPTDRQTPITIRPRLYWTDDATEQLISPSPIWTVPNAVVGIQTITCELSTMPLRINRIGQYYTSTAFPSLALLR